MCTGPVGTQCCIALLLLAALAMGQTSYLDNGHIRIGVDLARGGAISYLSLSGSSASVVNVCDLGRYIQQSYYGGPQPFIPPGAVQHPNYAGWPWNPVQAGDVYWYRSQLLAYSNDGTTLYIKCIPKQWALLDVPSECTMESWITLEDARVNVRHRLTNTRSDTTQYSAFIQELPAIYTVGTLCNLYTYTGTQPFTGEAVTRIENSGPPWANWTATENWSALINGSDWGLGVFHPGIYYFTGGFHDAPCTGGPTNNNTGYIAPIGVEALDYNILYEYEYVLILGTLDDIRNYVYTHRPDPRPQHVFREDRQHFQYVNANDTGWPIPGCLRLDLSSSDPQIIGPSGLWNAQDVPQLYIRAAFRTQDNHAELYFAPFGGDFSSDRRYRIRTTPDGVVRTYIINLLSNALYYGPIGQIRFDPVQSSSAGDSADIYSITSDPPIPTDFYITQQPSSQDVCPGATATFTVAATGDGTLSYQWQKNGSNVTDGGHYSGCTTTTLTVSSCDSNDAATNYLCVVNSTNGSENSKQATLSLKAATTVTLQPAAQNVRPGATATFTVAANGEGTLSYQWQKNGSNLTNGGHYSGCTTATLTISNTDSNDAASYRCVVTGGCGSATSNAASLTLAQPGDFDHDGDVDLDDFAHFQVCISGPQVAQTKPQCQDAKLDADSDVDAADRTIFLRCMRGPHIPPDPNCAN